MIVTRGDLWDWYDRGDRIVISTNIGHEERAPYRNNMGAGIAWQAEHRFPWLPEWYGNQCMMHGSDTPVMQVPTTNLIMFPVKPYKPRDTERGWAQDADWDLIDRRMAQLRDIVLDGGPPVALSTVGAGPKGSGGGLEPAKVSALIAAHLGDLDGVTLVQFQRPG